MLKVKRIFQPYQLIKYYTSNRIRRDRTISIFLPCISDSCIKYNVNKWGTVKANMPAFYSVYTIQTQFPRPTREKICNMPSFEWTHCLPEISPGLFFQYWLYIHLLVILQY